MAGGDYRIGEYRLRWLRGEAYAVWYDGPTRRRYKLADRTGASITTDRPARQAFDAFVRTQERLRPADAGTLNDLWELYVKDREEEGKKVRVMREHWRPLAPMFADKHPDQITVDLCRQYARQRFDAGLSASTAHTELLMLRTIVSWAAKRRIITSAPYVWLCRKAQPRQRVLTEEECIRLIEACVSPHVRLFVILALTTAGRTGAILELTWDRVRFRQGEIDLRNPQSPDLMKHESQKGRSCVPMNATSRAALEEAYEAPHVTSSVIEWDGKPVASIRNSFAAACQRAGLSGVTPHTLRHTAATKAWDAGVDPFKVSRLLGHSRVEVTRDNYAKPSAGYVEDATRILEIGGTTPRSTSQD